MKTVYVGLFIPRNLDIIKTTISRSSSAPIIRDLKKQFENGEHDYVCVVQRNVEAASKLIATVILYEQWREPQPPLEINVAAKQKEYVE